MKKRETVWQSRAHRRCFGICTVCLSLYIAYTTYLSQSGFLSGGVKTVASLCVFAVLSASLCRLLSEGCERLARAVARAASRRAGGASFGRRWLFRRSSLAARLRRAGPEASAMTHPTSGVRRIPVS